MAKSLLRKEEKVVMTAMDHFRRSNYLQLLIIILVSLIVGIYLGIESTAAPANAYVVLP